MKKAIIILFSVLALASCKYDGYELNENEFTSISCAIPDPVRTVIEGEDEDIVIGVTIGGMRENKNGEWADFLIDKELLKKYPQFELLPAEYYTISDSQHIDIPKGKLAAGVTLNFDMKKMMDDPLAYTNHYVFPMRIVETSLDSILVNKNFSMTVVKFINKYHGVYVHKGCEQIFDADDKLVEKIVYSNPDLNKNKTWKLITNGKNVVTTPGLGSQTDDKVNLVIAEDGTITYEKQSIDVESGKNSRFDSGNKKMYLNYSFVKDSKKHIVSDTLIFRTRDLSYETWGI